MLYVSAYGGSVKAAPSTPSVTVLVQVENGSTASKKPVNRLLFGNNIEWIQHGDGLLLPGSLVLDPNLVNRLLELGPTVIRYPGGAFADTFHWQAAMGPLQNRGMIENSITRLLEPADFGPAEFLQLNQLTGAIPLITANVVTGDAVEAASWVTATNIDRIRSVTGEFLPRVPFWEVGNEPYLTGERPDLALSAGEFAARVNIFIPAMRAADPSIQVGVPLEGDRMAQFLPAPDNLFNANVLAALTVQPDYFAVHNAYLPAYFGTVPPLTDVYLQAIAGAWLVNQDLDAVRTQVDARFPTQRIPFALTEYNALFTLDNSLSDGYIASFTSALYVADLLMMLAQRDDILMADFWSLLDNGYFGAIDDAGRKRPVFAVLSAFSKIWHGNILPTHASGPTFDAPAATGAGAFPGAAGLPTVTSLAIRDAGTLRVILVNKDPDQQLPAHIQLAAPAPINNLTSREYYRADVFETFLAGNNGLDWQPASVSQAGGGIDLTLKAHSIRIVEFTIPSPADSGPKVPCVGCDTLIHAPFPETGAWYNPDQSGSGISLEIQGGKLVGFYYGYDAQGRPEWQLFNGMLIRSQQQGVQWELETPLLQFKNGSCTGCEYQPPEDPVQGATIKLEFLQRNYLRLTIGDNSSQFYVPIIYGSTGRRYFSEQTPYVFPEYGADFVLITKPNSNPPEPWKWKSRITPVSKGHVAQGGPDVGKLVYETWWLSPPPGPDVFAKLIECELEAESGQPGCILFLDNKEYVMPIANMSDSRFFGEAADGSTVEGYRLSYD